jgi:hypothetical protein
MSRPAQPRARPWPKPCAALAASVAAIPKPSSQRASAETGVARRAESSITIDQRELRHEQPWAFGAVPRAIKPRRPRSHPGLLWRVSGYVPRSTSIWLYVPVTTADEKHLALVEPSDLLQGLVFRSREPRYVTVGVARDYRLVFEREWRLPENTDQQTLPVDVVDFLVDALVIALREDMPPARREIVYTTSQAIRRSRRLKPGRLHAESAKSAGCQVLPGAAAGAFARWAVGSSSSRRDCGFG